MKLTMSRKIMFSASHRYQLEGLSEEQNSKQFGVCFDHLSHGHNYTFEALLEGEIDGQTGLIMNLTDLDRLMKRCCEDMDHNHLNLLSEFSNQLPSTENIARILFYRLKHELSSWLLETQGSQPAVNLVQVKIFETADLWAAYNETL